MQKTLLLVLAMCGTASAQQFYRCTDSAGKVTLSDRACDASAADASRFVLKPNTLDSSEGRYQDALESNRRLKEQLDAERQGRSADCQAALIIQQEKGSSSARRRADIACHGQKAAAEIETKRRAEAERRRPVLTNCHSSGFGNTQCVSR